MLHSLSYTSEATEHTILLWEGVWKGMTPARAEFESYRTMDQYQYFLCPDSYLFCLWQILFLPVKLLEYQVIGCLSRILKLCFQVGNIQKSTTFLLYGIFSSMKLPIGTNTLALTFLISVQYDRFSQTQGLQLFICTVSLSLSLRFIAPNRLSPPCPSYPI